MAVDEDRRATAGRRRALIIETFSRELDPAVEGSAASRLDELLRQHPERHLIVSGDIDGLASAAMLGRVAAGWRAVALVVKSGDVLVHPDHVAHLDLSKCFGVDVFSTHLDNVSNHVSLWGSKRPARNTSAWAAAQAYDEEVKNRATQKLLATPSLWAGIEGSQQNAGLFTAATYRYPLGTAQILLALLEVIDRSPKLFDREFLPWLVANCDGGLDTIRGYPYNVPLWWSCMAAAVGPASLSEAIYQTAATQAPISFVNAVNRLRAEGYGRHDTPSTHLTDDWNLRTQDAEAVATVTKWISSISGWGDPFLGGADSLDRWVSIPLSRRGRLLTTGLPEGSTLDEKLEAFKAHLRESLAAVHTNFAFFDGKQRLNWVAAWPGLRMPPEPPLPLPLVPTQPTAVPSVENVADTDPVVL